MSAPITIDQVVGRLNDYPHDRYLYIGGFMRSVVWAIATYVLIELLIHPKKYWPRLLPWLASLLATMVTLITWGRGVLLTNSRANIWDSILPTLMGITEFCLFAVLQPRNNRGEKEKAPDVRLEPWNFWFLVLGVHALLAMFLVQNRISNTNVERDFVPELKPLANDYWQWLLEDKSGAALGAIVFLGIGVVMIAIKLLTPLLREKCPRILCKVVYIVLALLPLLPIGIYWDVINKAEKQRQQTDEFVFRLKNEKSQTGVVESSK